MLLTFVACGARSEIAGIRLDASISDASISDVAVEHDDAEVHCGTCGGEKDSLGHCAAWFICPNDPVPDGSMIICNDAPYQVACSCADSTCTCSHHGVVYKTLLTEQCTCGDFTDGGFPFFVDPAIIAACEIP